MWMKMFCNYQHWILFALNACMQCILHMILCRPSMRPSMRPSIEVPMMFMQTTKGALPKCSIREKGMKMTKLAQGMNKYEYTYTYIQIDRQTLSLRPLYCWSYLNCFQCETSVHHKRVGFGGRDGGAGRRRVADPSRGCLKREEEPGRERERFQIESTLFSYW